MSDKKNDPLGWIDPELAALESRGLYRRLTVQHGPPGPCRMVDGRRLVCFASNDYLGLAADPRLATAASQATQQVGWGSGASPLVSGYSEWHQRLESRLAHFEGTEAALVFPSGFAANMGTIAALVGQGDVVFSDRNNHASLLDGCRLSRADVRAYPHGDWRRLEALLGRAASYRRRLIVTDSLFSMDGDLAPLAELAELAERHHAMLMIDEAHATGVFGAVGRGVAEQLGMEHRVHVRVGTLSKALGSVGGFVAGSRSLIDWLVNRARPYVFSTASPPGCAAASLAALDVVQTEPHRRQTLLAQSQRLRACLADQGWNVGVSASQVVPVIVGDPLRAVALGDALRERGLLVPAIRPPTVRDGEARLRISVTYGHTPQMIDQLLESMRELRRQQP